MEFGSSVESPYERSELTGKTRAKKKQNCRKVEWSFGGGARERREVFVFLVNSVRRDERSVSGWNVRERGAELMRHVFNEIIGVLQA